jgi:nickel/cobalt transporter (NicO) family protein
MGLAGGLVPSPSALVVLLGAIALGRIPFGLALVAAYGVGLALTLVSAGLLLVRFDESIRGWASRLSSPRAAHVATLTNALPLVSGFAIGGAGLLLVIRAAGKL